MDSELYNLQQQNFLITVSFYNKTRKKAENYYAYIQKYRDYTKEYLTKIKKLFSSYSPSLFAEDIEFIDEENEEEDSNDNDDFEDIDENKSIFDLGTDNKNKININNNKNDIKENNIEIDISPIYKITNIIFKQFKKQIKGLKKFLKGIDTPIENLKKIIEKTKNETKKLKENYLNVKQNFFQNILNYKNTNENLLKDFSSIESKIAQFSFLKNNEEIYINNKNSLNMENLENTLNIKLFELLNQEKEFIKKEDEKKNYCFNFGHKSQEYITKIKDSTLLLIKNIKSNIENFLLYFLNNYFPNYKELPDSIKEIKELKNETECQDIINKNLKEINDNIILDSCKKYKPLQYNVKVLKNRELTKNFYDQLIQYGFNVNLEHFELNENDVYFIMKKMYNFSLVNKKNYDIDKENGKILIFNFIEKIFVIVENYKQKFNKEEIFPEEKLNKIYNLIENERDCRIFFLEKLSNKRIQSILEFPSFVFNILLKIFLLISDIIYNKKDMESAKQILILSQTFYQLENNEKKYICCKICKHQLFQKEDFWIEHINNMILLELQKGEINEKIIGRKLEGPAKNKKNNEIIFAQLLSMSECMRNFELSEEKIINILEPLFESYKIPEDKKELILNFIKKK